MGVYPDAVIDLQVAPDGRFVDRVSRTQATVTRVGPKYAVGPSGAQFRRFEGSATNSALHSGFESASHGWATGGTGTVTLTRETDGGFQGTNYLRIAGTPVAGSVPTLFSPYIAVTASTTMVFSAWLRGSLSQVTPVLMLWAYNGTTLVGSASAAVTADASGWLRNSVPYLLPAGTTQVRIGVSVSGIDAGDSFQLDIDCVQLEVMPAGEYTPSPYIATTTAAVSRNGRLAAERYPNGAGWWAAIEATRTNYLTNSYFESDADVATWTSPPELTKTLGGSALMGRELLLTADGTGRTFTKPVWTASAALRTLSCYIRTPSGVAPDSTMFWGYAAGAAGNMTVTRVNSLSPWYRAVLTYTSVVGDSTSGIWVKPNQSLYVCCLQDEVGQGATSYIPTKTVAVTRASDVVTFPASRLNVSTGTLCAVRGNCVSTGSIGWLVSWRRSTQNTYIGAYTSSGTYGNTWSAWRGDDQVFRSIGLTRSTSGPFVQSTVWATQQVKTFDDATASAWSTAGGTIVQANMDATIGVGHYAGGNVLNAPLHRLVMFSTALSESGVAAVAATIVGGVGLPPFLFKQSV